MSSVRIPAAGDVELAVRLDGSSQAPPLVLLHALGESADSWGPLLPAFTQHYRIAVVDLRGHGASDWPGIYSSELMRDDVVAAVGGLGFTRFALIGHSLGGVVALLVAQQLGDRITRLVIEDAVPPYPRPPRPAPARPAGELPFDWPVVEAMYQEMSDPAMRQWPALSTISAPTLIVAGGSSSHIPSERIAEMADTIPDCGVVTIDVGHHVHQSAPDQFTLTVLDWMSR